MIEMKNAAVDLGIVCSDFEESLRFYRDALGFEVVQEIEIPEEVARGACLAPSGFRQARLRAGSTLIKLMEIESPPAPRSFDFQAGVRWLTFVVEDVPSLAAGLRSKGIEFLGDPVAAPDAKYVLCAKGPDGMLIELVQLPDD